MKRKQMQTDDPAGLPDKGKYELVRHFLVEHPEAAWGDEKRPDGVGPGPDCASDACPLRIMADRTDAREQTIRMVKDVVILILETRDAMGLFTSERPETLERDLNLCRRWLISRVWHDVTQKERIWLSDGNFRLGVAVLNALIEKDGPHTVSDLVAKVGKKIPTVHEALVDWWTYEYRIIHDKALPFEREWRDGHVVSYSYNPEFELVRKGAQRIPVPAQLHPLIFLTRNMWIGSQLASTLLGVLSRGSLRFMPEWPEEMSTISDHRAIIVSYDAYFARKQPWSTEFAKMWLAHEEAPPEGTIGLLQEFVEEGGRILGLHDGGMALAARLAGHGVKALKLDSGREIEVRELPDGPVRRLGIARNNYASVMHGGKAAGGEGGGQMQVWCGLVTTDIDRERLNNDRTPIVGFSQRVGKGSVTGWTFLAGGFGGKTDLSQTDDCHTMMRKVIARFFG
jgi:hypothetical protein